MKFLPYFYDNQILPKLVRLGHFSRRKTFWDLSAMSIKSTITIATSKKLALFRNVKSQCRVHLCLASELYTFKNSQSVSQSILRNEDTNLKLH